MYTSQKLRAFEWIISKLHSLVHMAKLIFKTNAWEKDDALLPVIFSSTVRGVLKQTQKRPQCCIQKKWSTNLHFNAKQRLPVVIENKRKYKFWINMQYNN